jgi:tetratricopeptide (TPR) repeat protein
MNRKTFFLFLFLWGVFLPAAFAQTALEFFDKGNEAFNAGEYHNAIQHYERARALEPRMGPAYYQLGLAHKAMKAPLPEVAWYLKTAVELMPELAEGHEQLAKVYYSMGHFDKAEEHALRALAIRPDMVSAKFALGWIYLLGKSEADKAVRYFKEVLARAPVPYAQYGLGIAYAMNHDREQVLESITKLRSMDQEELAINLEKLLRTGNPASLQEGQPLVIIEPAPIPDVPIDPPPKLGPK